MDTTWDYTSTREYADRVQGGMPPVIITAAVTGDHQKSENPNLPISAEEQAQTAAEVYAAGASIIHIHGREAHDLTVTSSDAERYRTINQLIRKKAPDILIDNTSSHAEVPGGSGGAVLGAIHYFKGVVDAAPDVMALNPGGTTAERPPAAPWGASLPASTTSPITMGPLSTRSSTCLGLAKRPGGKAFTGQD